MFESLRKKLSGWIKKSSEQVKDVILISKPAEKTKKKTGKKSGKRKKPKQAREKKLGEIILEDIKQAGLEIKTPEERFEEKQLEQEKQVEKAEQAEPEKPGFFSRLFGKISKFIITEEYFSSIFSELELVLLENNVALEVVEALKEKLKNELVGREIEKKELEPVIKQALKSAIEELVKPGFNLIDKIKELNKPAVIVFFGINGSGKTTTIAKLAYLLKKNNISSVLAAADTFRAASIEQLEEHGKKLGIEVIKSQYSADPASVAFDAIKHAKSKGIQAVLIDTAGRMHTKTSLLKEMEKIIRIAKPDLKIFIGESITGNDATQQAKVFQETIGIDGIILSKADVDEKSGTILSVSYVTGKPILYLGVGQGMGDLKEFKKEEIIKLLGL